MENNKLTIRKFKPSNIKQNSIIGIIGRRASGKTYLIKDLMKKQFKEINRTLIFSATEYLTKEYIKYINLPNKQVYDRYNSTVINDLIQKQYDICGRSLDRNKKTFNENQSLIILDNILQMVNERPKDESDTLKYIFFNSRHLAMSCIFTMQGSYGLNPEQRANIDYIFIFNEPSLQNRKRLYNHYGSVIPSFEIFNHILECCTTANECLVIDLTARGDIENKLFWYKADNDTDINPTEKIYTLEKDNKVPVQEPIIEPVQEPIIEPIVEPIVDPVVEVEPIQVPVVELYEVIEKSEIEIEIENNRTYLGYIKSFIW